MRRLLLALPAACVLVVLAGCTSAAPEPAPTSARPTTAAVRFAAGERTVVVDGPTAAARAVQASRAFFAASPGVVLAPQEDGAAQRSGAKAAERLHIPLLLVPGRAPSTAAAAPTSSSSPSPSASSSATSATPTAVIAETRRLGATWAISFGHPDPVPGLRRRSAASVAALPPAAPRPAIAVAARSGADTAALATARAAGADVVALPGGSADLNADPGVVKSLAAAKTTRVVLIGGAFAGRRDLDWAVDAARTGWQYAGGGQRPFDGHRLFVALYGTPGAGALGVLGQQDGPQTIARVRGLVQQYADRTDRTVAPMLEVIATVASGGPTGNHDYSGEIDAKALEPYIDAANAAGIEVVLDLQPGRSDFLTQAKEYASLLEKPGVGLALDPEWRLGPTQKPLVQIGRVSAAEVNRTSAWLADLVRTHDLPPKPFVLHEFRLTMLQDRREIVVNRPELDTLIHVDGQGGQPDKQATWRAVRAGAPDVAWGWKNFLKKDHPVLTPAQTLQQVHPTPDLITYQ